MLQQNSHFESGSAVVSDSEVSSHLELEFEYEPIFMARTKSIVAYEQLARKKGGVDASFLQELSKPQIEKFDSEALVVAKRAASHVGSPVFVNGFPENIERMALEISSYPSTARERIGLEVNENLPVSDLVTLMKRYPEVWWVLDDIDQRKDALETITHPGIRRSALTVKFNFKSSINEYDNVFEMSSLPANWMVIAEGVKPDMFSMLTKRGVPFIQGRDLGFKRRNPTGDTILV